MSRELQPHEIEERAAEARSFMNSTVVQEIFEDLQAEYLTQLIQADVGGLTAATAHASMKVLEDIRGKIKKYVVDEEFRRKKGRR